MKTRVMAAAVAIAMYASSAVAWDGEGHMMVAAIAWKHLNDTSRARVAQLLKLNPSYGTWIAGAPADQQDQIAFVTAATWPDAIKDKNSGYKSDGDRPLPGPASAQNIGYADKLQHKYWHFIDTPFSTDGTPLIQPVAPNAQTQISLFTTSIKSSDVSDDIKSYDLVWLEHLVGDVHQPLHATSRFSHDLPDGDQGGNLVVLACADPCSKHQANELHAFWDNALGTSKTAADAIAAAERLAKAPAAATAVTDERVWIQESFEAAKQFAYALPAGPGAGPYQLDATYKKNALTEAQARVALAGARLADLINSDLR